MEFIITAAPASAHTNINRPKAGGVADRVQTAWFGAVPATAKVAMFTAHCSTIRIRDAHPKEIAQ